MSLPCGNVIPFDVLFLAGREKVVNATQAVVDELVQYNMGCAYSVGHSGNATHVSFVAKGVGICFPTTRPSVSKIFVERLLMTDYPIAYTDPKLLKVLFNVWGVIPLRVVFCGEMDELELVPLEKIISTFQMPDNDYYQAIAKAIQCVCTPFGDGTLDEFVQEQLSYTEFCRMRISGQLVGVAAEIAHHTAAEQESKQLISAVPSLPPTPAFTIHHPPGDSEEWVFETRAVLPPVRDLEYCAWMKEFPLIPNNLYFNYKPGNEVSPTLVVNNLQFHGLASRTDFERVGELWRCVLNCKFASPSGVANEVTFLVTSPKKATAASIATAGFVRVTRGSQN